MTIVLPIAGPRGVRLQGQLRVHRHRRRRHRADGPQLQGEVGALLQVGQGRSRVGGVGQRQGIRMITKNVISKIKDLDLFNA